MDWMYGVTTVPDRRDELLPRTLVSLCEAGFGNPRLFIDSCREPGWYERRFGLPVTARWPKLGTIGNWCLALVELYARNAFADRYAVFQDDMITVLGLREYLERSPFPPRGYLNLFTFRAENEKVISGKSPGWYEAGTLSPRTTDQCGRGAVALVFDNAGVRELLSSGSLVRKPRDPDKKIRTQRIDGGVVAAMNAAGYREYVHAPSLVQHLGVYSSIGNHNQPRALTFPGEAFDARNWL